MKVMDMGLFWLQVSEGSGYVSTQNGCKICPSIPFGEFLWTLSTRYGSFPIPSIGVCTQCHTGDDSLIIIIVNFGNL